MMKINAVIFDLFGTLIPGFSEGEYRGKVNLMAAILGASPPRFWELWEETFYDSMTGILPSLEARTAQICDRMGISPEELRMKKATEMLLSYIAENMLPRLEAEEVISGLRSMGYKIGLISDCGPETPGLWGKTSLAPFFDATLFSCSLGMKKPDPRIYKLALDQLGVEATDCLYIGDGSSTELTGAAKAGLLAVHLRVPGEDGPDVYRVDKENWQGKVIKSLKEILPLIQGLSSYP